MFIKQVEGTIVHIELVEFTAIKALEQYFYADTSSQNQIEII